MTQVHSTYSTETIAQELHALELPDVHFLSRALVALMTGRKASIQHLTNLMPGQASQEAKRQQFRRFLDQPTQRAERWARALATLLPVPKPWVVAIDRTQWKVGEQPVNLLVLAVVCKGCAVPLLWIPLEKAGASDTQERIELLERFVALFGAEAIRFVTADREFIGRDWIGWLLAQRIGFRIRIKAGEWLLTEDGREKQAGPWFAPRACASCLRLSKARDVAMGSARLCWRKASAGGQE